MKVVGGTLCGGAALYGGTCWWALHSAPRELTTEVEAEYFHQSAPSSTFPISEEEHVNGFLDANKFLAENEWDIETSHFGYGPRAHGDVPISNEERLKRQQKRLPTPAVEVLKLKSMNYDEQAFYQETVPILRIVGYFPDATPKEVCDQLVDTSMRMKWDSNYRLFERLIELPTSAATAAAALSAVGMQLDRQALQDLTLRIGAGLLKAGRRLAGANPPEGVVEDRAILAHRVASTKLEKVGVAGRYFCYERLIRRYDYSTIAPANNGSFPHDVYSILYRSLPIPAMHQLINATCPPESQPKPGDLTVFMHAQEILLIPIRFENTSAKTIERGLVDLAVHRLHRISGIEDETGNTAIASWMKSNAAAVATQRPKRRAGTKKDGGEGSVSNEGVLMIMTSVNDGKMPKGLPRWAERLVAQYFTSATYTSLHEAVQALRNGSTDEATPPS